MNHTPRLIRLLAIVALLALVLAGCGDDTEVGSGVKLDEKGEAGALRDPATTTTAPTTTTIAPTTTTAKPTATTKATTTTTAMAAVVIKIQDDKQGVAFDPPQVRVKRGQVVEWKNVSAEGTTRQIRSEKNVFRSPPIPPGGTWRWTANVPGTHNYADETRPYAVAAKLIVE